MVCCRVTLQGYNHPVTRLGGRPSLERPDSLIAGDHFLGLNHALLPEGKTLKA